MRGLGTDLIRERNLMTQPRSSQVRAEALLRELVNIDSPTSSWHGVNRVQRVLARELETLGFDVRFILNPRTDVRSGDLLLAELRGDTPEFVTFVCHADTVLDLDSCGGFRISKSDPLRAFGAGIIDNKGGITVLIEGLRYYIEGLRRVRRRPRRSLRVVCSPNEEDGSLGFHDLFRSCALDSELVLGFEPALENGSIIESRRGNRWYQIHVKGQEAHAGRCRGEQINAAHELAITIAKLQALNDPKADISVNVSQLQGGRDRFNVVCGEASAKLDVRFPSLTSRDAIHFEIERLLFTPFISSPITGRAAETEYEIVDDCPPFTSTTDSLPIIEFYLQTVSRLEGREIRSERTGGAGDVNYMSRKGVAVFDGLGPVGGSVHTPDEYLHLPTLASRSLALAVLLDGPGSYF